MNNKNIGIAFVPQEQFKVLIYQNLKICEINDFLWRAVATYLTPLKQWWIKQWGLKQLIYPDANLYIRSRYLLQWKIMWLSLEVKVHSVVLALLAVCELG